MLRAVFAGERIAPADVARALRASTRSDEHTDATVVAALDRFATAKYRERAADAAVETCGTTNYVCKVGGAAMRVSRSAVQRSEFGAFCTEMRAAVRAHELGVGLEVVCFGLVDVRGKPHFASWWPWAVSAASHARRITADARARLGGDVLATLRTLARSYLHLDATNVGNVVLTVEVSARRSRVIDFDPNFVRAIRTEAQRAAAARFTAVQMLLLESWVPGLCPADAMRKIVAAGPRRKRKRGAGEGECEGDGEGEGEGEGEGACTDEGEGEGEDVAAGLSAAATGVLDVALFDVPFAVAAVQVLMLYIGGALHRRECSPRAPAIMRLANDEEWVDELVRRGDAAEWVDEIVRAGYGVCYDGLVAVEFGARVGAELDAATERDARGAAEDEAAASATLGAVGVECAGTVTLTPM
jgi:hypothetical protein